MNTECRVSGVVWWLGGGENVHILALPGGGAGGARAHVCGGVRGGEAFPLKKGGEVHRSSSIAQKWPFFDPFGGVPTP